jgi:hypothetical protein
VFGELLRKQILKKSFWNIRNKVKDKQCKGNNAMKKLKFDGKPYSRLVVNNI